MKDERRRVHFVGVGAMGSAMVRHLATPDITLSISDADDERAAALAIECSATAVPAAELGATAGRCDVMVLMLPDTEAVSSVLLGEAAVLERLPVGAMVIDMGSSDPRATRSHAKAAGLRQIALLDAPVSGGVPRARTASLSIMVGGDPAAAEHVRDLLLRMGEDVQYLGPSGAGHAMKALNNLLSAIGLLGASEVLAIGREFGLDPHLMLDVLNKSTGGNHATRVKMAQYALSGSFDSNFSLALMLKDLRTAVDVAGSVGVEANLGRRCLEEWQAAHELLGPDADHTHIWKFVETERSRLAAPVAQADASPGTTRLTARTEGATMASQDDPQEYIDDMVRRRGYVLDYHRIMAQHDFDVLLATDRLVQAAYLEERSLDRRTKELIFITSLTVMRATKAHIQAHINVALRIGVSPQEILEAIEIALPEAGVVAFQAGFEAWSECVGAEGIQPKVDASAAAASETDR